MKLSGIDEKTTFIRETIPIIKVPPILDIGQDFTKRELQLIQKFYYQLQNHIETKNLNNFYRNIKTFEFFSTSFSLATNFNPYQYNFYTCTTSTNLY